MIVTVLGSGSAEPTRRRSSSGYLVEWSGGALLLDPSAGTYMRALKAGLDPRRLRAVVLTHFHPDHVADLPALVFARKQSGLDAVPVAGPAGTAELVDEPVLGYPCEMAGLYIEARPARHSPEAVCLRLTSGGKTLAYSGDTADCDGLRAACRDAELALLECTSPTPKEGHMTPADCAAVIEAARPRRVLLTHLGPDVECDLPTAEDGLVVTV